MDRLTVEDIEKGLADLRVSLDAMQQQQLLDYLDLLIKWNQTYNLTAIRRPQDMLTKHILDSLSIAPYVEGRRVLDVGTGPGFPGVPLAIADPARHLALLDSNGKKLRFVRHACREIKLENIEVVNTRVESWQAPQLFDCIVVRAFGSIGDIMEKTTHLLNGGGRVLIMKGALPEAELVGLDFSISVHELVVPGLSQQRHLICVTSET